MMIERGLAEFGHVCLHASQVLVVVGDECVVVFRHERFKRGDRIVEQASEIESLHQDFHSARLDLREIQDVVDKGEEVVPGRVYLLEVEDYLVVSRVFGVLAEPANPSMPPREGVSAARGEETPRESG